jgi:hypothetical protein
MQLLMSDRAVQTAQVSQADQKQAWSLNFYCDSSYSFLRSFPCNFVAPFEKSMSSSSFPLV